METPDRLAAYLADELDPADRRALDDELARDGQLRATLAAMRRADDALAGVSTPTPDEGFDARMDAFVDEVLAELESAPSVPEAVTEDPEVRVAATSDGGRTGWILAAAAAVILLAGVGVATLQPFGADDAATPDAELSSLDDSEVSDDMAADTDQDGSAGVLALPMQPTIVDEQRSLDDDQLDELLSEPALTEVAAAQLDRDEGTDFGLQLQRQLGQTGPDAGLESDEDAGPESDEDAEVTDDAGRGDGQLFTRAGEPVDETLLIDSQRCLGTLLEAGPTAIPTYIELATVDGQQALVFGLVTIDPDDDGFTRREIWTLERSTCQVLRFAQG